MVGQMLGALGQQHAQPGRPVRQPDQHRGLGELRRRLAAGERVVAARALGDAAPRRPQAPEPVAHRRPPVVQLAPRLPSGKKIPMLRIRQQGSYRRPAPSSPGFHQLIEYRTSKPRFQPIADMEIRDAARPAGRAVGDAQRIQDRVDRHDVVKIGAHAQRLFRAGTGADQLDAEKGRVRHRDAAPFGGCFEPVHAIVIAAQAPYWKRRRPAPGDLIGEPR